MDEKTVAIRNTYGSKPPYSALCDQVTKVGLVPRGVVKMVVDGVIDALEWNLTNHLSVKLGDFGTFRPAFGCKSRDEEKDVTADILRHRKIIFTPGAHFKEMLRKVSIQKFDIPETDEPVRAVAKEEKTIAR